MNKKKIELQVLNISNSQAQAGAYALVLGEVGGKRQLPIIIGATEAQAMVIEMKGIVPPRPLTHNLFASVLEVLGVKLMRILIYKVDNGVFYSYLYMKAEETILRIDARTSDAVALALRMNAPIFVYEEILETECLKTGESTTDPMGGSEPDKSTNSKTICNMHVFYTPDIQTHAELPEEEAAHAVRVLRLQAGDEVMLTDGKGCVMNLLKSVISFSWGRRALSDCLMAETRILEMRSVLMTFRSEKRQFRNVSSSNPISVAFSTNHSIRSMFLVGAMAIWRLKFQRSGCFQLSKRVTSQCLGCARLIAAL